MRRNCRDSLRAVLVPYSLPERLIAAPRRKELRVDSVFRQSSTVTAWKTSLLYDASILLSPSSILLAAFVPAATQHCSRASLSVFGRQNALNPTPKMGNRGRDSSHKESYRNSGFVDKMSKAETYSWEYIPFPTFSYFLPGFS